MGKNKLFFLVVFAFLFLSLNIFSDGVKDKDWVDKLKEKGLINSAGLFGDTPLITSIKFNNYRRVKLLLENGADVNMQNKDGKSALMIALKSSFWDYPKIADGEMNKQIPKFIQNKVNIADLLLENGADVNQKDKNGMSPLMFAALEGNDPFVAKLLQKGANPAEKNNKGRTILEQLDSLKEWLIMETLIRSYSGPRSPQDAADSNYTKPGRILFRKKRLLNP